MATTEFGTGKSVVVLAIVIGCFAILWPKIFYPMMQAAFSMTSPKHDNEEDFVRDERPPHLHSDIMHPRVREVMGKASRAKDDKVHIREGRPFPHPSARQPVKSQPKSGGAMSIIMPIYTIGIVVFFLYTVLKLVFKKSPEEEKQKPVIKDFHMDSEYHKFACPDDHEVSSRERKGKKTPCVPDVPPADSPTINKDSDDMDEKDYEIYQLKKRLEETEAAMERIMKHMGAVSECFASGAEIRDIRAPTDKVATNSGSEKEIKLKTSNIPNDDADPKRFLRLDELKSDYKTTSRLEEQSPDVDSYEIISSSLANTPSEVNEDLKEQAIISYDVSSQPPCEMEGKSFDEHKKKQDDVSETNPLITDDSVNNPSEEFSKKEVESTKISASGTRLEREASINSETSSFEVLSQSHENGRSSSSGGRISVSPASSDDSVKKDGIEEGVSNSDIVSFENLTDTSQVDLVTEGSYETFMGNEINQNSLQIDDLLLSEAKHAHSGVDHNEEEDEEEVEENKEVAVSQDDIEVEEEVDEEEEEEEVDVEEDNEISVDHDLLKLGDSQTASKKDCKQ